MKVFAYTNGFGVHSYSLAQQTDSTKKLPSYSKPEAVYKLEWPTCGGIVVLHWVMCSTVEQTRVRRIGD